MFFEKNFFLCIDILNYLELIINFPFTFNFPQCQGTTLTRGACLPQIFLPYQSIGGLFSFGQFFRSQKQVVRIFFQTFFNEELAYVT